jgi:hypothetical protein
MMAVNSEGFWISPEGDIIKVSRHIDTIVKDPEIFGFTKEQLEDEFKKQNEPFGSEGNARENIIKEVYRRGWIRVREYFGRGGESISIQTGRVGDKQLDMITQFAEKYSNHEIPGMLGKYAEVNVLDLYGFSETHSISEIAQYALYKTANKMEHLITCRYLDGSDKLEESRKLELRRDSLILSDPRIAIRKLLR